MLVNIYNKKLTTTEVAIVALFPLVAFHFYQYIGIPRILERMCFHAIYIHQPIIRQPWLIKGKTTVRLRWDSLSSVSNMLPTGIRSWARS